VVDIGTGHTPAEEDPALLAAVLRELIDRSQ
jgi:hypothetical protein